MIRTIELAWRFGTIEVPENDLLIREALELTGEYSGRENDLYQALLNSGDVALDIGANVGTLTVGMARTVGETGRVIAFEPQPTIAAILARNMARHDLRQVEVRREIVSDSVGSGEFADLRWLPHGDRMNLGAIGATTRVRPDYGAMAETPVTTVDALVLDRCNLIKVDVEGAEAAVLAGAAETIARCRPFLSIECDRPNDRYPWVDALLEAGYRLWRFRGTNMRAANPNGASLDGRQNFYILMLVAIPSESPLELGPAEGPSFLPIHSRQALEDLSARIVRPRV